MWGLVVAAPLWRSVKKYFEISTPRSQYFSHPFLRKNQPTHEGLPLLLMQEKHSLAPQVLQIEGSVLKSYLLSSGAVST